MRQLLKWMTLWQCLCKQARPGSKLAVIAATIKYNSNGDSLWVEDLTGWFGRPILPNFTASDDSHSRLCLQPALLDPEFRNCQSTTLRMVLQWSAWIYKCCGMARTVRNNSRMAIFDQSHDIYITGRSMGSWFKLRYRNCQIQFRGSSAAGAARYNGPSNNLDFPYGIQNWQFRRCLCNEWQVAQLAEPGWDYCCHPSLIWSKGISGGQQDARLHRRTRGCEYATSMRCW